MALQVEDRRSARTREAVLSAFLKVLFARGYDAVTVGDVVAAANVGRSTFYEHFTGKDDLLKFSLRVPFGVLADIVGQERVNDSTLRLLAHFRERRKAAPVLFSWPVRPLLTRALAELVEARLSDAKALVPKRVVALQVAEVQLALVDAWITGRAACSIEAAAEALHASTSGVVRAMYGKAH